jgi:hypothetical protein
MKTSANTSAGWAAVRERWLMYYNYVCWSHGCRVPATIVIRARTKTGYGVLCAGCKSRRDRVGGERSRQRALWDAPSPETVR